MTLTIRTFADPLLMADSVRKQVWAVDKDQPIGNVSSMEQLIYEQVSHPRFYLLMLTVFAGVALVLASVGIYGVMSHMVTQRTHEIGVRRAMGARDQDVIRMILGHGLVVTLIGILIGVAGSMALTRVMTSLLYEVSTIDPITFVISPLLLIGVALVASYIPARRATKVDPQVALRYQ
jgi:putative ABC transport system permease protein